MSESFRVSDQTIETAAAAEYEHDHETKSWADATDDFRREYLAGMRAALAAVSGSGDPRTDRQRDRSDGERRTIRSAGPLVSARRGCRHRSWWCVVTGPVSSPDLDLDKLRTVPLRLALREVDGVKVLDWSLPDGHGSRPATPIEVSLLEQVGQLQEQLDAVRTVCESQRAYCSDEQLDTPSWVTTIEDALAAAVLSGRKENHDG